MPSNIDPNFIGTGPVSKDGMKQQLTHARNEINTLETQVQARLPLAGGTLTGALTLHANPTAALHASPKQYVDSQADARVAKAGDTMTGNLTISKDAPELRLTSSAPSTRIVRFQTGSNDRLLIGVSATAESGSDTGSNTFMRRVLDNGTGIDFLVVERNTGRVRIEGSVPLRLPAVDPTDADDATRKAYVDANVDAVRWSESGNVNASGSAVTISGLPSGVREIVVNFHLVSTNGTQPLLLQLGSASTFSGSYQSSSMRAGGTAVSCAGSSSGFLLNTNSAAASMSGFVHLTRFSAASPSTWQAMGMVTFDTAGAFLTTTGHVVVSESPVTRVRISCSGADTFDGGTFSVMWRS